MWPFAHLPPLARREDAFELFWADELMRAGTAPSALLKVIDLNPDLLDLRKFNRDQPRVPAGNGRESGRWDRAEETRVIRITRAIS